MMTAVISTASALFVGALVALLAPPRRRLATRVRPWTASARASLGAAGLVDRQSPVRVVVLRPALEVMRRVAETFGSDDGSLDRRLEQAGLLRGLVATERATQYRLGVAGRVVAGAGCGLAMGVLLPVAGSTSILLALLGGIVGGARSRADVDRRIQERRQRLRVELATATQLLAMTIRIGGGVVQALQRFADNGHGLLAGEVREVLAQHSGGVPIETALRRAADRTPEPFVARTHRLLAVSATHGSDLAQALLALGEEVRTARREELRRTAVRRRAAMLVPTIAVLAPVMLLFVAAPLPTVVFGSP